jgi:hypothetical protein
VIGETHLNADPIVQIYSIELVEQARKEMEGCDLVFRAVELSSVDKMIR